ncbi:uncharacterized protein LOC143232803 [Tachypleus tridentatus]|uniref:uncharacterized protein LOC143232803 n=1 Tax=Tachypleus tridentatus TaxID=6853 RepID=UPI003FD365AB
MMSECIFQPRISTVLEDTKEMFTGVIQLIWFSRSLSPWATKPTVVRYPWWMEELTLISICLIALCVLCCFCNVNEKARGKWKALKNRILGSCGVFAYTKLEDQELVTKKITPQ